MVASAILADVEPGFQPGGKRLAGIQGPVKYDQPHRADFLSGRQDVIYADLSAVSPFNHLAI